MKEAVHERDRHLCGNCGRSYSTDELDVDHNVQRGNGGSERFSNLSSLCRRCHDAKHGNGLAPTARFASTGDMTTAEFRWFEHFVKEILPALVRQVGVRLEPKFNLAGALAARGHDVLAVDADPQGGLTASSGTGRMVGKKQPPC